MKIKFTEHSKYKMKIFDKIGISKEAILKTLEDPDETLYDTLTDRLIAINYKMNIAVPFEKKGENITVITILYSSELKDIVRRRKRSGRWI